LKTGKKNGEKLKNGFWAFDQVTAAGRPGAFN
jgi:hypothetical protein